MADKGDRVKVRFVKNSLPYTAGDEAWFNEIQAASFIKQGYATRVDGRAAYVPAPTRAQVMAEESRGTALRLPLQLDRPLPA